MKPFIPSLLMLANAALVFLAVWSGDKPDDTLTIGLIYAAALAITEIAFAAALVTIQFRLLHAGSRTTIDRRIQLTVPRSSATAQAGN